MSFVSCIENIIILGATLCLEMSDRVPENIFEVRGSAIAPESAASERSRVDIENGVRFSMQCIVFDLGLNVLF